MPCSMSRTAECHNQTCTSRLHSVWHRIAPHSPAAVPCSVNAGAAERAGTGGHSSAMQFAKLADGGGSKCRYLWWGAGAGVASGTGRSVSSTAGARLLLPALLPVH